MSFSTPSSPLSTDELAWQNIFFTGITTSECSRCSILVYYYFPSLFPMPL